MNPGPIPWYNGAMANSDSERTIEGRYEVWTQPVSGCPAHEGQVGFIRHGVFHHVKGAQLGQPVHFRRLNKMSAYSIEWSMDRVVWHREMVGCHRIQAR